MDKKTERDLLAYAWGIIANVDGGPWDLQTNDWIISAKQWRADYGKMLKEMRTDNITVHPEDSDFETTKEWSVRKLKNYGLNTNHGDVIYLARLLLKHERRGRLLGRIQELCDGYR